MTRTLPPFALLVEEHGTQLLRHARRLAGSEAEDLLQETLLKALRSYPRLRNGDHLRAWLFRVLTTTAFDRCRKVTPLPLATVPERANDPELYDDAFGSLLEGLTDTSRAALELRFVQDLSYNQLAERLGISPEAARQRVSSAIRTLRGRIS